MKTFATYTDAHRYAVAAVRASRVAHGIERKQARLALGTNTEWTVHMLPAPQHRQGFELRIQALEVDAHPPPVERWFVLDLPNGVSRPYVLHVDETEAGAHRWATDEGNRRIRGIVVKRLVLWAWQVPSAEEVAAGCVHELDDRAAGAAEKAWADMVAWRTNTEHPFK